MPVCRRIAGWTPERAGAVETPLPAGVEENHSALWDTPVHRLPLEDLYFGKGSSGVPGHPVADVYDHAGAGQRLQRDLVDVERPGKVGEVGGGVHVCSTVLRQRAHVVPCCPEMLWK